MLDVKAESLNLVKSPAKLPQFYTPGMTPPPRPIPIARPIALVPLADGRGLVAGTSSASEVKAPNSYTSEYCLYPEVS